MTYRGPFQPLPFCDSVIQLQSGLLSFAVNHSMGYKVEGTLISVLEKTILPCRVNSLAEASQGTGITMKHLRTDVCAFSGFVPINLP